MRNEQILKKAIEKAIKNGYKYGEHLIEWIEEKDEQWGTLMDSTSAETIIFSHDFAKAFWGEESWKTHLQQMVLEEDPIKYLEKFL